MLVFANSRIVETGPWVIVENEVETTIHRKVVAVTRTAIYVSGKMSVQHNASWEMTGRLFERVSTDLSVRYCPVRSVTVLDACVQHPSHPLPPYRSKASTEHCYAVVPKANRGSWTSCSCGIPPCSGQSSLFRGRLGQD